MLQNNFKLLIIKIRNAVFHLSTKYDIILVNDE